MCVCVCKRKKERERERKEERKKERERERKCLAVTRNGVPLDELKVKFTQGLGFSKMIHIFQ